MRAISLHFFPPLGVFASLKILCSSPHVSVVLTARLFFLAVSRGLLPARLDSTTCALAICSVLPFAFTFSGTRFGCSRCAEGDISRPIFARSVLHTSTMALPMKSLSSRNIFVYAPGDSAVVCRENSTFVLQKIVREFFLPALFCVSFAKAHSKFARQLQFNFADPFQSRRTRLRAVCRFLPAKSVEVAPSLPSLRSWFSSAPYKQPQPTFPT